MHPCAATPSEANVTAITLEASHRALCPRSRAGLGHSWVCWTLAAELPPKATVATMLLVEVALLTPLHPPPRPATRKAITCQSIRGHRVLRPPAKTVVTWSRCPADLGGRPRTHVAPATTVCLRPHRGEGSLVCPHTWPLHMHTCASPEGSGEATRCTDRMCFGPQPVFCSQKNT